MPNPFVHLELNSTDVPRAKTFYKKLFAWKLTDVPMPVGTPGKYTFIDVGKGTGGGMMKQLMPDTPSAWLAYVLVDDIDASTRKAERLGAEIMKDVTEVGELGWLSIIVDPTGALLGLWEPKPAMRKRKAKR